MEDGYKNAFPPVPSKKTEKRKKGPIGRSAAKVRNFIRKLLVVGGLDASDEDPQVVKALIPQAWFTKRGPGRLKDAQRAYARMTPAQRSLAIRKGWFPASWADMSKGKLHRLASR